jgi:ribulose-5-phosphate 4-epimerase/fuculose-1-phosphate aldolase
MKLKLLEVVALTRDLPEHGLRAGAIGTIVEVYGSTALEVEFTDESGNTLAVLTLSPTDIRKLRADELATLKTPATGP